MSKGRPSSLEEAINTIIDAIDPDELKKTRAIARTTDLDEMAGRVHHTLGMFFRNEFHLWQEDGAALRKSIWDGMRPERREFYTEYWKKTDYVMEGGEDMHADDASHELLVETLRRIRDTE